MLTIKRPYGFGGIAQLAEFLNLSEKEVRRKATSGEWPSYMIAGRRVFDIDELLKLLVSKPTEEQLHAQLAAASWQGPAQGCIGDGPAPLSRCSSRRFLLPPAMKLQGPVYPV